MTISILGCCRVGSHFRWAVRHGTTLRTDPRYSVTNVFETFPQPPPNEAVATMGKSLYEHRAELLVRANEGLTSTYNHVHDPDDTTPGIHAAS